MVFNHEAAHRYGELLSRREQLGQPIATADAVIAATTFAHGGQLATRNMADFADLGLVLMKPWTTP